MSQKGVRIAFSVWAVLTMVIGISSLSAEEGNGGGFSSAFSDSPYQIGEPVVGTDGWVSVGSLTGPQGQIAAYAPSIEPLLRDQSKSGLFIRTHGIQKNTEEKLLGQIRVSAVLSFGEKNSGSLTLIPVIGGRIDYLRFGYAAGISLNEECLDGIYYEIPRPAGSEGEERREMLVERGVLMDGEPYTVILDLDLDKQTFDMRVTGRKADGTPLDVSAKGVSIQRGIMYLTKDSSLTGVRVVGRGVPGEPSVLLESLVVEPNS